MRGVGIPFRLIPESQSEHTVMQMTQRGFIKASSSLDHKQPLRPIQWLGGGSGPRGEKALYLRDFQAFTHKDLYVIG